MRSQLVYASQYNIGFGGLERLHPFDSRKYGRAWERLRRQFGKDLDAAWIKPDRQVSRDELLQVHTEEYLETLSDSSVLAKALELPIVAKLPRLLVDRQVLTPMRWAVRGTILAAEASLEHGFVMNLSGGYHHAKPASGEGFCIYSDIGLAVASMRSQGLLREDERVVFVDTDAHQGNGVAHVFREDSRVFLFDIFNGDIYPNYDYAARNRVDCPVSVSSGCSDDEYLERLEQNLTPFLDSVFRGSVGLAIYNAGTDVLAGDPLGLLDVSAEAVVARDQLVVEALRQRGAATVMLPSGGYTDESHRLIADSIANLLDRVD